MRTLYRVLWMNCRGHSVGFQYEIRLGCYIDVHWVHRVLDLFLSEGLFDLKTQREKGEIVVSRVRAFGNQFQ